MESKPLIFIDTPNDIKNTKIQNQFDSRKTSKLDNHLLKKINNIITLNKKGKKIRCKITTSNSEIRGILTDIDNTFLFIGDKKIILDELLKLEITNV